MANRHERRRAAKQTQDDNTYTFTGPRAKELYTLNMLFREMVNTDKDSPKFAEVTKRWMEYSNKHFDSHELKVRAVGKNSFVIVHEPALDAPTLMVDAKGDATYHTPDGATKS